MEITDRKTIECGSVHPALLLQLLRLPVRHVDRGCSVLRRSPNCCGRGARYQRGGPRGRRPDYPLEIRRAAVLEDFARPLRRRDRPHGRGHGSNRAFRSWKAAAVELSTSNLVGNFARINSTVLGQHLLPDNLSIGDFELMSDAMLV